MRTVTLLESKIEAMFDARPMQTGIRADVPGECLLDEKIVLTLKGPDLEVDRARNDLSKECVGAASVLRVDLDHRNLAHGLREDDVASEEEALELLKIPTALFGLGLAAQQGQTLFHLPVESERWEQIEWGLEYQQHRSVEVDGRSYLELTIGVTGEGEYLSLIHI